jgi:hypothetical protein
MGINYGGWYKEHDMHDKHDKTYMYYLCVLTGSHFPVKAANLWVGRFLGALMGINYGGWYKEHDMHDRAR